jgi:nucleoside-diphosphate-sugar epimerase
MPARVLLTGGAGLIGTQLREGLTDYQVRVSDRDLSSVELRDNEEAAVAELGDFEAVRKAVDGCDYIVHLAADPRVHAPWKDLRVPNFDGVYNVFEAAKQAGTRRIVFASTNHVTGLHDINKRWPTRPDGDVAPDSLYGASKAFGEALGRFYTETSDLSVLCLRIGWVNHYQRPDDPDWLRMWLSFRDLRQLVRKSLAAPDEIRFGIYYGVSNNTPMLYDLSNAREELGYEPEDDSADVR